MKRIVSIFLTAAMLFLCIPQTAAQAIAPAVRAAVVSASAGEIAEMPIAITDNPGITAMGLEISYDKARLKLIQVRNGDIFADEHLTAGNDSNAVPYVLLWEDAGTAVNHMKNGTLAVLRFEVLEQSQGIAEVSVKLRQSSTINSNLQKVPFSTVNGAVRITEQSGCLQVGTVAAGHGERVRVPITLAGNPGVMALRFAVSYDPSLLHLAAVENTDLMGKAAASFGHDLDKQPYYMSWDDTADHTQNGVIVWLVFDAAESAAKGMAAISLTLDQSSTINTALQNVVLSTEDGGVLIDSSQTIQAAQITAAPGEQADVAVTIADNPGVAALAMDVQYDRSCLVLESVENGSAFADAVTTFGKDLTAVPYVMMWEDASTRDMIGNGTLAILHFRVLENAPEGQADVKLSLRQGSTVNTDLQRVGFLTIHGGVRIEKPVSESGSESASSSESESSSVSESSASSESSNAISESSISSESNAESETAASEVTGSSTEETNSAVSSSNSATQASMTETTTVASSLTQTNATETAGSSSTAQTSFTEVTSVSDSAETTDTLSSTTAVFTTFSTDSTASSNVSAATAASESAVSSASAETTPSERTEATSVTAAIVTDAATESTTGAVETGDTSTPVTEMPIVTSTEETGLTTAASSETVFSEITTLATTATAEETSSARSTVLETTANAETTESVPEITLPEATTSFTVEATTEAPESTQITATTTMETSVTSANASTTTLSETTLTAATTAERTTATTAVTTAESTEADQTTTTAAETTAIPPETSSAIALVVNTDTPNKVEAIFNPQENINERGEISLRSEGGLTVTFDRSAAERIAETAGEQNVSIVIEIVDEISGLPVEQQGGMFLSIKLLGENDEKVVFADAEGGLMTVQLIYTCPDTIKNPTAYCILEDGTLREMPTIYDAQSGLLTFTASDCANYMIAEAGLASAEEQPPVIERLRGDVTGDGKVDAEDASEILLYAAALGAGETYESDSFLFANADTDENDTVDAADASNVLIYAAILGAEGTADWSMVLG